MLTTKQMWHTGALEQTHRRRVYPDAFVKLVIQMLEAKIWLICSKKKKFHHQWTVLTEGSQFSSCWRHETIQKYELVLLRSQVCLHVTSRLWTHWVAHQEALPTQSTLHICKGQGRKIDRQDRNQDHTCFGIDCHCRIIQLYETQAET